MHKSLLVLLCSSAITYGSDRYDIVNNPSTNGSIKSGTITDKKAGKKCGYLCFGNISPLDPLVNSILRDTATPTDKAMAINLLDQEIERIQRELERVNKAREVREIHKGIHR